jgi:Peptidase family M23/Ig-like domain CHU_C associated
MFSKMKNIIFFVARILTTPFFMVIFLLLYYRDGNCQFNHKIAFTKNDQLYIGDVSDSTRTVISNQIGLEQKIWTGDTFVRFSDEISENLLIPNKWVLGLGIHSPFDKHFWVCLERAVTGEKYNVFLFDEKTFGKKKLFNDGDFSEHKYSYKPICWSNDKDIIYLERIVFDTHNHHEGIYSYNLKTGIMEVLNISTNYMMTPILSYDRKYFLYGTTSKIKRDLLHGTIDGLAVYDIEKAKELILDSQVGATYNIQGWVLNTPINIKKSSSRIDNTLITGFKLPWEIGKTYCVTRDGNVHATGIIGSTIACTNLGSHTNYIATDFDTPNNADDKILAVANGVVTVANFSSNSGGYDPAGYGNWIVITHPNNYRTLYAHLKLVNVNVGDNISQGCFIGVEGTTGASTGDHLHFEYEYPGGVSGNLYTTFDECNCIPHLAYSYTSANSAVNCIGCNVPSNDNCVNATAITSNGTSRSGTVACATGSYGANLCSGCSCTSPDDKDVYYSFTAQATSHTVTISNYASNFDAVIELRTACSSGTAIGCYDPSGTPSSVSNTWTNLTIGQTYYIRVFEFNYTGTPPSSPTFDISVTHSASICTDQHESNNTVSSSSLVFAQPVSNSSNLTWQGNIGSVGDDDWYKINVGACGTVTVNLSNLPFDYDIELWDKYTNISFGKVLSKSDNYSLSNESVTFNYQGSNTAYIKVYAKNHQDYTTNSCYNIQFLYSPCTGGPPSNDICSNATLLPVNNTCIPLTNQYLTNANSENRGIVCDDASPPIGYDVWYKFVANATSQNVTIDNGGSFSAHIGIYPDCSSARINCGEGQGIISIPLGNLTVGHTYYIQIHDLEGYAQNMPFSICVINPNQCTIPTPTANTASSIGQTSFQANWTLVSVATAYYLDVSTVSNFSSYVSGYNNRSINNVNYFSISGLTCNTNYYYRVRANNSCGTSGSSSVITTLTSACSGGVPPNDLCAGAITISCSQTVSGSTTNATANDNPVTCVEPLNTSPGIWYKFIGNGNNVTISTCNVNTNFDTVLGIFSGSCGNLTCIAGNDDASNCGIQSTIAGFPTVSGTTYYIYVTGYQTATGNFDLNISCTTGGNSCTNWAVTPNTQSVPATGGSYQSTVTATGTSCSYSLTFNDSWLHSINYTGGVFTYSVDANTTCASRTGTISVNNATDGITNIVTLTVTQNGLSIPSAVTVSGGGTFCNSTTLTASGGSGGTIYWQGTTSSGTNTLTTSTSQTVTTSGTYYFRANNSCGWGTEGNVAVTINTAPSPPSSITGNTAINTGSSTSLTANGCAGTLKWYDAATSGNLLFTGNPLVQSPTSNTTYYASCTTNTCESQSRTSVTVTVCPILRESLKSGNWDDTTLWSCGTLPVSTNIVQINTVHTVTLPPDYIGHVQSIIIKGKLIQGVRSQLKFGN